MKWPSQLVIVRHAQSQYNVLRELKSSDPLYQEFKRAYNKNYRSEKARDLASQVRSKFSLGVSDYQTKLTPDGVKMALKTGKRLRDFVGLPHVIIVSPYARTMSTLDHMKAEWLELNGVKTVSEDRIREQEHGLSLLYNDWRVFEVMHPEQKELRELQGPYWYKYPQGESVSDVRDRIRSVLSTIVREYSGQRVMVVTHHLTLLSIRATLERLTPEEFVRLDEHEKPVNCGVTIYNGDPGAGRDGRLDLYRYNMKLY